jgi:uncharacterized membrane protein
MASRPNCPEDVRRDRGQAAIEFVLTLPLVVILVLAVVQVAIVLSERARMESITWSAARSASVAPSPTTAAQDVVTELVGDDAKVLVDDDGRFVTVRVRRTIATDVPVVGRFFPDVTVESELTLLREPPLG